MKFSYAMVAFAALMTSCTSEPQATAQELTGDKSGDGDKAVTTAVESGPMTLTSCTSDYYEISISRDSALVFNTDVDKRVLENLGALWQSYLTMNWDILAGQLDKEAMSIIEEQSTEDRHFILKKLSTQETPASFLFFMVVGSATGEMPSISDAEIGRNLKISDAPTTECLIHRSKGPKYEI